MLLKDVDVGGSQLASASSQRGCGLGSGIWEGRSPCWVPQSCGDLFPRSWMFPVAGAAPSSSACSERFPSAAATDQYHVCTGIQASQCFLPRSLHLPSVVELEQTIPTAPFCDFTSRQPGMDEEIKSRDLPLTLFITCQQENDEMQKRLSTQFGILNFEK